MNNRDFYLSKVEVDADGNTYMLFPEALLKKLDLKQDEILRWDFEGDKVILTRPKIIDTVKQSS